MNILVCIKRIPATGARIILTEDGRAIETRNLGFTISPHEECAIEEAVRLVEAARLSGAADGRVTVLTLGPEAATEQLRDALAVGADRAIHLLTDGREWDAIATANAIIEVARLESFDLLLFGNEAADTGDYQVGIRVAVALGRPCVTGVKGIEVRGGTIVARREAGGSWEIYEVPLPAVLTVKEGLNLPRYPSVPGRLRAKKKPLEQIEPVWQGGGLETIRLVTPPEQGGEVQILGHGVTAVPRIVEILQELRLV